MSSAIDYSSRRHNVACHFCDHAARRPGRLKTALLVPCTEPECRKVYCSRPACIGKLGLGSEFSLEQNFQDWRDRIESGKEIFTCPHCKNEETCPGPQCARRFRRKSQKSGALRVDTQNSPQSRPPSSKESVASQSQASSIHSPVSEASSAGTSARKRHRPDLHVRTEFDPEPPVVTLGPFDESAPVEILMAAAQNVLKALQDQLKSNNSFSSSAAAAPTAPGLSMPPMSRTRSGTGQIRQDLSNALAAVNRSLRSKTLRTEFKVPMEDLRASLERFNLLMNLNYSASPYPQASPVKPAFLEPTPSSSNRVQSLFSPSEVAPISSAPWMPREIPVSDATPFTPLNFSNIPAASPLSFRATSLSNLPSNLPGLGSFSWTNSDQSPPTLQTPVGGQGTKRTRNSLSGLAPTPKTPNRNGGSASK